MRQQRKSPCWPLRAQALELELALVQELAQVSLQEQELEQEEVLERYNRRSQEPQ